MKQTIKVIPKGVIPYKLSDWGVKKDSLEMLTEKSFTKGRMDNNIQLLSKSDVKDILERIY